MADRTLTTRIKQLVMTSTQWTAKNPVLLQGEYGFESDTNKFKVGDGTSTWSALSYNSAASADAATKLAASKNFSITSEVTASAVAFDGSGNVELSATIADGVIDNANISSSAAIAQSKIAGTAAGTTIADDLDDLDTAIETEASDRATADGKITGSLGLEDGKKLNFTSTVDVGGIKVGDVISEKDVATLLQEILCPYVATKNPQVSGIQTQAGASISASGEYGTTWDVGKVSASWTAGSTQVTKVEIYKGSIAEANKIGTVDSISSGTSTTADVTDFTINGSSVSLYAKVYDSNGSKSYTSSAASYGSWWKPWYYGLADSVPTTSAEVKALTKKGADWSGQKVTFGTITSGNPKYCVLVLEASKSISSVKDPNNFEVFRAWTSDTAFDVELDSGATVSYKVWHTKETVTAVGEQAYTIA